MAITINIRYTGTNGNARRFAEEMENSGTVAAIRQEAGNLRYEYYIPVNDPETVPIFGNGLKLYLNTQGRV